MNETGALGCAVIGAAASGEYASLADAAAHMCRISQPIMPDQIRSRLYDEKYELYLQAIQALDPLWDRLQGIPGPPSPGLIPAGQMVRINSSIKGRAAPAAMGSTLY